MCQEKKNLTSIFWGKMATSGHKRDFSWSQESQDLHKEKKIIAFICEKRFPLFEDWEPSSPQEQLSMWMTHAGEAGAENSKERD